MDFSSFSLPLIVLSNQSNENSIKTVNDRTLNDLRNPWLKECITNLNDLHGKLNNSQLTTQPLNGFNHEQLKFSRMDTNFVSDPLINERETNRSAESSKYFHGQFPDMVLNRQPNDYSIKTLTAQPGKSSRTSFKSDKWIKKHVTNQSVKTLKTLNRKLSNNKFNFLYINPRSLKNHKRRTNISELLIGLPYKMDVIFMSETWIEESEKHLHRVHGFNGYFSCRPVNGIKKRGGGCAIFTSENLKYSENVLKENNENYYLQSNLITTTDDIEITVASIYRSNAVKIEMTNCFFNFLDNFLSGVRNKKVILCGDSNIHMNKSTKTTRKFLEILERNNFKILNNKPTRESNLLDLIISNIDVDWNIITFPFKISNDILDHKAIIVQCNRHF